MLIKKYPSLRKIFGNLLEFNYERVYSIKEIRKSMKLIDIETSSSNFLANGYLVHNSKYRVYIRRGKGGTRIARMIDAPNLPEAEAVFRITEEGIRDP